MAINTQAVTITNYLDPIGTRLPSETERVPWRMEGQTISLGTSYQSVSNLATAEWFKTLQSGSEVSMYLGRVDGTLDSEFGSGARDVTVTMRSVAGVITTFEFSLGASGAGWQESLIGTYQTCLGARVTGAGSSGPVSRTNGNNLYIYRGSSAGVPAQNITTAAIETGTGKGWGSANAIETGTDLYLTRLRGFASTVTTIKVDIDGYFGSASMVKHLAFYELVVEGNFDIALHETIPGKAIIHMNAKSATGSGGLYVTMEGYLVPV